MSQISVLNFGSSALRSDADLPLAVHEIYREWRAGRRVLAVVSALGCTADDLLKRAQQLGLPPQREGLAALLGTGETAAAALLTLALDRSGLPATLLDPTQTGLITHGDDLPNRRRGCSLSRSRVGALHRGRPRWCRTVPCRPRYSRRLGSHRPLSRRKTGRRLSGPRGSTWACRSAPARGPARLRHRGRRSAGPAPRPPHTFPGDRSRGAGPRPRPRARRAAPPVDGRSRRAAGARGRRGGGAARGARARSSFDRPGAGQRAPRGDGEQGFARRRGGKPFGTGAAARRLPALQRQLWAARCRRWRRCAGRRLPAGSRRSPGS